MAELARTDPRSARLQHSDGLDHPAGEQDARKDREPEAGHEEDRAQHDRSPQRREGLGQRLLGEDQPTERLDGGVARHDPATLEADGLGHDIGRAACGPGCVDLRKRREVSPLEDGAYVGVCHEDATLIDDVHVAGVTDLDLRDDAPDRLEVDFGRRHLGRALAPGHRDGEVRLGLLAEIHRAEARASDTRLREAWIRRQVAPAADFVGGQAGHQELHPPVRIELDDLSDGRHVAKQAQEVDLALLAGHRGFGEGHFHRCSDLLLDALHELLDSAGGGQSLLALEPDQSPFGLPVGEVEVDDAAHEQHAADQQDEDGHVLAKEPAARRQARHRRMTSARKRI